MAKHAVCFTENSIHLRSGCRNDGRTDRGTPRQRRVHSFAARRVGTGRPRRTRARGQVEASPEGAGRIRTGGFDTELQWAESADWIIEAIIEQPDAKRALLQRIDATRRTGSIVSSNTSGLSIAGLAAGRSDDFRRHWLGTHFFNPPRYLPLLEIIPTAETDPAVVAAVHDFADRRLGKNVVVAKDTPGFIANHVAMFGLVRIFDALAAGTYTVEEIDAITGAAIGRPKSATFRTADIAGVDILVHVANDLAARLPGDRGAEFQFPPFVLEMVARGWIGEKAGRGFYERRKNDAGETDIWTLDPQKMEYRPRQPVRLPALDAAASLTLPERMRKLFSGKDRVGEFLQSTLPSSLRYTAEIAPEIAHSIDDIDGATDGRSGHSSWLTPLDSTTSRIARRRLPPLDPSSRSCEAPAIGRRCSRRTRVPVLWISETACSLFRSTPR